MTEELLRELRKITAEEQELLSGCQQIQKNRYMSAETDMVDAAKLLAETPQSLAGEYPKTPYESFKDYNCYVTDRHEAVFDIGSQGMLGGQYWSLMNTADGAYRGQSETYYEVWDGNNIIKAEHIDDNWWYLWEDYDASDYSNQ